MSRNEKGFSTKAVHAGEKRDITTGSVITPIYQTSIFGFSKTSELIAVMTDEVEGNIYTRFGNPTLKAVRARKFRLYHSKPIRRLVLIVGEEHR